MRVISGKYKGKKLEGFDIDGTRPTMDRIKESVFGIIQNHIQGSICLDLFAGSGSLGIEAISNGAKICYFVDNNPKILPILEKNLKNIENTSLIKKDFRQALEFFKEQKIQFDLIFLDPPYSNHFINQALNYIQKYHLLKEHGMIICEYETEELNCLDYKILKEKKYGNKFIRIYEK